MAQGSAPPGAAGIDDSKPLLQQLVLLGPVEYEAWLMRPSRGRARFFASNGLEVVTKVKWWVVPLLWLPLAVTLVWQSLACNGLPVGMVTGLVAAGVLLWQLAEYSLHRWLFHASPSTPFTILAHFLVHGNHHKYPSDVERLVFPPLPACLPAGVIYGALRACFPKAIAAAVFSGVLFGYVAYDCMHYFIHSGSLRGSLRMRHMHHHFADGTAAFGISSALFDIVFGTQPQYGLKNAVAH